MRHKKVIVPVLILAVAFLVNVSCQRTKTSSPDPFGPATGHLTMDLEAYPNVLYVTAAGRATSDITALIKSGGAPLSGAMVIFTIPNGKGEFTNYQLRITATTNSNGVAQATYVSPSLAEFSRDFNATVEAQVQTDSPYYLWKDVAIRVMRPKS